MAAHKLYVTPEQIEQQQEKRRAYHRDYMKRYRKEHPEYEQSRRIMDAKALLLKSGYTVNPIEGGAAE